MAMAISYNWLFLWDYTFYKWGFLSTYNWYNLGHNCNKAQSCTQQIRFDLGCALRGARRGLARSSSLGRQWDA